MIKVRLLRRCKVGEKRRKRRAEGGSGEELREWMTWEGKKIIKSKELERKPKKATFWGIKKIGKIR